jgi:hypothetical protein
VGDTLSRVIKRRLRWDDPLVYELVEVRRQQWDVLIWQIPLLTFTGQAFIFTVLLGPDTTKWGRLAAGAISIAISLLGLLLLARHRQAEQADATWLSDYESKWPADQRQHGDGWIERRNRQLPGLSTKTPGRTTGWARLPLFPGYKTWVVAHFALALFSLAVIVLSLALPIDPFAGSPTVVMVTPADAVAAGCATELFR